MTVAIPHADPPDLRHVGGTLAAATGASLKELMARLGHSSTRAAMIYQHATRDRDEAIARRPSAGSCIRCDPSPTTAPTKASESRPVARLWPAGLQGWPKMITIWPKIAPLSWDYSVGAGEGNRTLMTSLEGWGSAIELRPHCELAATVAYRVPGLSGHGAGPAGI